MAGIWRFFRCLWQQSLRPLFHQVLALFFAAITWPVSLGSSTLVEEWARYCSQRRTNNNNKMCTETAVLFSILSGRPSIYSDFRMTFSQGNCRQRMTDEGEPSFSRMRYSAARATSLNEDGNCYTVHPMGRLLRHISLPSDIATGRKPKKYTHMLLLFHSSS